MEKSATAFRTISEVADHLETPAHVLRFWESRFPQIKPVKRAGGRRYYRPADVALLAGIRRLLHDEGMTIRGVQKILREQGVRHVSGLPETDPDDDTEALEAAFAQDTHPDQALSQVVSLSDWVATADPTVDVPPSPEAPTPDPLPIADDEIVPEDAFRSAMDWAKSLSAQDRALPSQPIASLPVTGPVAGPLNLPDPLPAQSSTADDHSATDAPDDAVSAEDAEFDSDAGTTAQTLAAPAPFDPVAQIVEQSHTPAPPHGASPDSLTPPDSSPPHDTVRPWLPTPLRRLTAADLAPHSDALHALHARLAALHTRMAEAVRSSRT